MSGSVAWVPLTGKATHAPGLETLAVKALLVETDEVTRGHLQRALMAAGHDVEVCVTGQEAILRCARTHYEMLILDCMAPVIDGLGVLKVLRTAGVDVPVFLTTLLDDADRRQAGLEAGADDYLVKPFTMAELLARVQALSSKRPAVDTTAVLRASDLEIDPAKRKVHRGGRPIKLREAEFKILEYLVRHAGQIVTPNMLLENVWSFHYFPRSSSHLIESQMKRLRSKVDDDFPSELIHTVRGVGYIVDAHG